MLLKVVLVAVLAAVFATVVPSVIGDHCAGGDDPSCHGQPTKESFLDQLSGISVPTSEMSQCSSPEFCDDSTPGTGHDRVWSDTLTSAVLVSEQCYSLCFSSINISGVNFSASAFPEVYHLGCSEVYVCLAACMMGEPAIRALLGLSTSATCTELCNVEGGICDIAFRMQQPQCSSVCQPQTCALHCSSALNVSDVVSKDVSNPPTLSYPEDDMLSQQGAVEFSVPGLQPAMDGTAYGVVWRAQYEENDTTVEYYIPQHLPFILLPGEVGPLYRRGSNMLAIRQFQCRQDLNLSYALVTASGRSNFSQPLPQCFYGNNFPQPPSNISIEYGFNKNGELKLEVSVLNLSPDHSSVTEYGLQVFTVGESSELQFNSQEMFPDRENLKLIINGTSAVSKFLPTFLKETTYLFGVFALPQNNITSSGRTVYPVSSWAQITTGVPNIPAVNGSSCYSIRRNHASGLANLTIQYRVSSGGRSLAAFTALKPKLTLTKPMFIAFLGRTINQPLRNLPSVTLAAKPTRLVYSYEYSDVTPTEGDQFLDFDIEFQQQYNAAPKDGNERFEFKLAALTPSIVRGLVACYNSSGGSSFLSVTWQQPKWLEGSLRMYELVIMFDEEEVSTTTTDTKYSSVHNTSEVEGKNIAVSVRVLVRPGRYTSDLPGESAKVSFIAGFGSSDARSVCTRQDPVDEENRMAIEIDQCDVYKELPTETTATERGSGHRVLPFSYVIVFMLFYTVHHHFLY